MATMETTALQFVTELRSYATPTELLDGLDRCVSVWAKSDRDFAPLNVLGIWRTPPRDHLRVGTYVLDKTVFMHGSVPKQLFAEWKRTRARLRGAPSILTQMAWMNDGPFTFTECMRKVRPRGEDRWIFDFYNKFTIRDGFYCPVHRWMVVFWSRQVLRLSEKHRGLLYFMAVGAAGRLAEMAPAHKTSEPNLTAREIAVLQRLSRGQSPDEIAKALDVKIGTIDTFIERAKRKLKAKTRTHAVANAMRSMLLK